MIFRGDWAQKLGGAQPKNADDFLNWMVRFTKENPAGNGSANTFGLGGWTGLWFAFPFFTMMFRAPHTWRQNPDGTLTHAIETPEYKQAIEYIYEPSPQAVLDEMLPRFVEMQVYQAILDREYAVVQSTVLVIATAFVLVNLATDLLYRRIDPRVREQ